MNERIKNLLKEILIEKGINEKILDTLQKLEAKDNFEKGYLSFINGLVKFYKKELNNLNKFLIYKELIENKNLEKLKKITEIKFYDDAWTIGFKTALKDAIEILSPNAHNVNERSDEPKEDNPR